jgi:hypothetical protein
MPLQFGVRFVIAGSILGEQPVTQRAFYPMTAI